MTGRLVADSSADPAIARAAALLRDPAARTEDVAGRVGLSERQLRRRTHAAAGYGPKTLQRILRFQRFVRTARRRAPDRRTWPAAAAMAGYADQPHLTRECVALSGLTPAALARPAPPGPGASRRRGTARRARRGTRARPRQAGAACALEHVGGGVPGRRPDRAPGELVDGANGEGERRPSGSSRPPGRYSVRSSWWITHSTVHIARMSSASMTCPCSRNGPAGACRSSPPPAARYRRGAAAGRRRSRRRCRSPSRTGPAHTWPAGFPAASPASSSRSHGRSRPLARRARRSSWRARRARAARAPAGAPRANRNTASGRRGRPH